MIGQSRDEGAVSSEYVVPQQNAARLKLIAGPPAAALAMSRTLLILAAIALTSACRRLPRPPRFAVELPTPGAAPGDPPTRVIVPEGLGSDSQFALASLSPVSPRSDHPAGWETLDLNYAAEGDKVRVTVFALHEEYDARRHATVFRSKKLGGHTARVEETVRLEELESLGYRPFSLRVVAAK